MEPRLTDNLKVAVILIVLLSTCSSENDLDMKFCGTWRHGKGNLNLSGNVSPGCDGISISANKTTLSINGKITAQCKWSDVISLKKFGFDSAEESFFCLYWEPLLDQLRLQFREKHFTLCWPASLQGRCCTDLSHGANTAEARYGIINGTVKTDQVTSKTLTAYTFNGTYINCCKEEWMVVYSTSVNGIHLAR